MWLKSRISGHTAPMWTPDTHSHSCARLVSVTEWAICHVPLEARWSHVWPRPGLRTSAELTALQNASMGNSGNCGSGEVHLPCTHEATKCSTALRTDNFTVALVSIGWLDKKNCCRKGLCLCAPLAVVAHMGGAVVKWKGRVSTDRKISQDNKTVWTAGVGGVLL